MAHERKSELNRFQGDVINPETPHGLPSDDVHPDGEPQAGTTPAGAPDANSKPGDNASVDWGTAPGEEPVREDKPSKPDKVA